jgi:hypothetical protein
VSSLSLSRFIPLNIVTCLHLPLNVIRTVCLVIAPTFFSAADYILLGTLVRLTGYVFSVTRHPSGHVAKPESMLTEA